MKIIKLKPLGFCKGVDYAYNKTIEIITKNPKKEIILIGQLVHNKLVNDQLLSFKNVTIIDDSFSSRLELISNVIRTKNRKNTIIIFSAHGSDYQAIELARQADFEVYDLTCGYVKKTLKLISKYLTKGYQIAYFGVNNHPEFLAAKALDENIVLITNRDDLKKIQDKNTFFICQTTMSYLDFEKLKKELINFKSKIIFSNEICNECRIRQENVLNITNKNSVILVVSDSSSNNGKTLYKLATKNNIKAYIVSELKEVIEIENFLKIYDNIYIVSSSSTSSQEIEKITNHLARFN